MFEDSLLESGGKLRTHRSVKTMISLVFQLMFVGVLVLLPLLSTEALPKRELLTVLVAPPPPPAPPVMHREKRVDKSEITPGGHLLMPIRIPEKIQMNKEEVPPPAVPPTAGVLGGITGGQAGGVIGGIIKSMPMANVMRPIVVPERVRVSQGVTTGMLVHKVIPRYPPLARIARIQGQVVLNAIISKNGKIENLRVASGPPMLDSAAIEAVKDWRYRPYLLNGQAVEVETKITVDFSLG